MVSSNGGHFPRYWPFVGGIHRWPVDSPSRDAELWCFLCHRHDTVICRQRLNLDGMQSWCPTWPRLTLLFLFPDMFTSIWHVLSNFLTLPLLSLNMFTSTWGVELPFFPNMLTTVSEENSLAPLFATNWWFELTFSMHVYNEMINWTNTLHIYIHNELMSWTRIIQTCSQTTDEFDPYSPDMM